MNCSEQINIFRIQNEESIMNTVPTRENIELAHLRIKDFIHRTPVLTSETLNRITGTQLFFKCENFQKVGAFKFRGASNAILSLDKTQLSKGVATHSSGNHAAALSLAAKMQNAKAYIVMPRTAPEIKKKAVAEYKGKIIFCEPNQKAREETLEKVVEETGAEFIHPYNNYKIIEGQATCAKEIFEEVDELNYLLAPVGGGGLISGSALSAKYFSPATTVIGAEPKGADDAFRSIRDNKIYPSINPQTIADGLLTSLSEKTFPIIKENVKQILTVEEESIIKAMRLVWERMKIIIEPSSAVPLAAILENKKLFEGKRAAVIFSGGNVALEKLPWSQ